MRLSEWDTDLSRFVRVLLAGATAFVLIVAVAGFVRETLVAFSWEMSRDYGHKLWRLNGERTVGAWLSSMLMAGTGGAMLGAAVVEWSRRVRTWPWWALLCLVLFALSADELLVLHEGMNYFSEQARSLLGGFGAFPWVIVGIGFTTIIALITMPFLLFLPRPTAVRLLVAGAVFVGGALGVEMISAYIYENVSTGTLYDFATCVEETLELTGMLLGLRAALMHLVWLGSPGGQSVTAAAQAS